MNKDYATRQAGEHKNYKWFEADYLRRASVKDALKEGREVPQTVLDEFPDLKGIKPTKQVESIKIENTNTTGAILKPSNNPEGQIIPSSENNVLKNDSARSENVNMDIKTESPTQMSGSEPSIGKTQGEGRIRERGFSTNEQTNINSDKTLQNNLASDKLNYMQLENKSTYGKAKQIFDKGYDESLGYFNAIEKYEPHDVPLAHMIANEASKRGDIETARNVIVKISEKLTEAGQFGQAGIIMRRSDPATYYRYLNNNVNRLNREGLKRYGDKWNDLKLSPEVEREIFNLEIIDEASMSRIMERTNRDLIEQMPADAWEKWDTWRRMSMLLNPKTHVRNIVGNGFMAGLGKTSDTWATPSVSVRVLSKAII